MATQGPVVQLPYAQLTGLVPLRASATTLSVSAGTCWDSTSTFGMVLPLATTLNTAVVGANGIDVGALAASTWYYVFLIADETNYLPVATLLSLSATAPTLPAGYSLFRRIGSTLSTSGSAVRSALIYGSGAQRQYVYVTPIAALSAGTSATYVGVDLTVAVPPISNTIARLSASFTPSVAGDALTFSLDGTIDFAALSSVVAAKAQSFIFDLPTVTATVSAASKIGLYYKVTASGSATVAVLGYVDYL